MLSSPAFKNNQTMPEKYTIDGGSVSPPLKWEGTPKDTKSFALVMDDLDVPPAYGGQFIHWMVYNIPAVTLEFKEGAIPAGAKYLPNPYASYGMPQYANYGPPWPPDKAHRYQFTLYALKADSLNIPPDAGYAELKAAIDANVIESSKLIGLFGPAKTPQAGG